MPKTASLNIRLDAEIKKSAETIFSHYGLSLTEAVTVFIHQSCNVGGLPFDLRPPQPDAGAPIATAGAEEKPKSEINFGFLKDKIPPLPDSFFDPLPDEELELWEL